MPRPHPTASTLILALALAVPTLTAAFAQAPGKPVPTSVNYQGRLSRTDGTVVADGTYSLTFKLYDRISGGTARWEEKLDQVVVRNGVFSVLLGTTSPLRESVFANPEFLEVQINDEAPLRPRMPIAAVPFALRTEVARRIVDGAVTTPKLVDGAITPAKLASDAAALPKVSGGLLQQSPELLRVNGGISYAGVLDKLDVGDSSTAWVRSANFMFGHKDGRGSPGRAMVDIARALVINYGPDWPKVLLGGDVDVAGNLSKAGGSFKIDHPQDPKEKYLYHSFVESPDMKNIYDGVATLNEGGEAIVSLPGYFEALNRDFRYQLTCISGFAAVYVKQEVRGNRFMIAGGKPGLRVSWQVTGIRKDAWANAHRIPNEVEKPAGERGHYMHPEVYDRH
jgi:hypothetical protein